MPHLTNARARYAGPRRPMRPTEATAHRRTSGGIDMCNCPFEEVTNMGISGIRGLLLRIRDSRNLAFRRTLRLARASWYGFVATMFKGKPKEV